MYAPIGCGFKDGKLKATAMAVACVAVFADLLFVGGGRYAALLRLVMLLLCLIVYGHLGGWAPARLGLLLRPRQPVRYWFKAVGVFGGIMLVWLLVAGSALAILGYPPSLNGYPPGLLPEAFYAMCVSAPVFEEVVYRFILCVPAMALVGPRWTIVLSGVVFALYHTLAGVAAPDNLVAGFILGWAFLRSGSLAVPILLHALGNLCVLLAQYAVWVYHHGMSAGAGVLD